MKPFKYSLIIITFCLYASSSKIFAQIVKHQLVIEATGFYQKGEDLTYPFTPAPFPAVGYFSSNADQQNSLKLGGSVGYMINSKWLVSVGLTRTHSTIHNVLDTTVIEFSETKLVKAWGERNFKYTSTRPYIEVKYIYRLSKKLWLAPSVMLAWGKQKYIYGEISNIIEYTPEEPHLPTYATGKAIGTYRESKAIQWLLSPTVGYCITPWLGVKLATGGLSLLLDNRQSYKLKTQQFTVNFNPSQWTFGLFSPLTFLKAKSNR
ncbi:hypothetical protein LX87_05668 [Larkinella arboricola]|uniref:Outer membrane protein with beta-barrel domain n=1 Tax=Larkinella arboricola TaxID=643671 RepID=A0A327WFE6_LARAB|nr:hypothetical protein [Larkinella arboricola]RAJ89769.1 hypothetical protein LX87_05668 [Larkinella arboricola]